MNKRFLRSIGFIILTGAGRAQARLYNYQDIPMGERAFGMASACVAVPGDVGNTFYNPAVMAFEEHSQVSGTLSAYERIDTRTGQYVSLFRSAADNVSRGGFLAIPSFVGGNIKSGDWIWGGAILVPFSFLNSGTLNLSGDNIASFESKLDSVWMGPFIARKFGRHAFGASIFYASRQSDEKFFFVNTDTSTIRFNEAQYYVNGIVLILGGTYELTDNLRLGYSFRLPPLKLGGNATYSDVDSTSGGPGISQQLSSHFDPMPVRLSLGLSWQLRTDLLLAMDLHLYGPIHGNIVGGSNPAFDVDAKVIPNVTMGAEWMTWPHLGFRLGFFTNLSSAGNLSSAVSAINDKVNMFGGTSALIFAKENGSISLGGYIQGGQGSSTSLESSGLVPRSNYIYGFVVGTSYKF